MFPFRLSTSRNFVRLLLVVVAILAASVLDLAGTFSASAQSRTLQLRKIERVSLPELLRVVLELEGDADYRYERLPNPNRLYFDLKNVRADKSLLNKTLAYSDDVIRQIRLGRRKNNVTRVVLDLGDISSYRIYELSNPSRLVIDLTRTAGDPVVVAAAVAPPFPSEPAAAPTAASAPSSATALPPTIAPEPAVVSEPPAAPERPAAPEPPAPEPARPAPTVRTAPPPPPPPATTPAAGEQRAILEVLVNGLSKGEALVVFDDQDGFVKPEALEEVGIKRLNGRRKAIAGAEYVVLSSLAPDVTFKIDEAALSLHLTVTPDLLGSTVVDLERARPLNLTYSRNASGFMNYALNWRPEGTDLFTETGVSVRGALLTSTLSRGQATGLLRGMTTITFDQPSRLRRWTIGDSYSDTGLLGGGLFVAGIGLSRDYGLDPYFVRYPTLGLSGATTSPSTVEVYVNDRLVRREQVPAGQFELRNVPVPNGRTDARLVIRDAFGRSQDVGTPFYLATTGLQKGLQEYRYQAGVRRNRAGTENWNYSDPVFMARHRVGVTDWLTLGGRFESTAELVSGGPAVTTRTPVGELTVAGAASRDSSGTGSAGSAAYSFTSRRFGLGGFMTAASRRYATVTEQVLDAHPLFEANAFASMSMGALGSLSLHHAVSNLASGERRTSSSVSGYASISSRATVTVTTTRIEHSRVRWMEFAASLSLSLGEGTSGDLGYESREGVGAAHADLQHSLPTGVGYGYRLQTQTGAVNSVNGALQYQGAFGRYEVQHDRLSGQEGTTVTAAGGLVAIGGKLHVTRPVQESYALVRVPGVEGVRAYLSHQEVGRTNRNGDVLVPNLLPYYGNRLDIADEDVPLSYGLASTGRVVAPPYRGGALISFPVESMRSRTGIVIVETTDGAHTPVYGQLTVRLQDRTVESPIGLSGEFYLENLPAGRHPAVVQYGERTCRFAIDVPDGGAPIASLGTIHCIEQDATR